MIIFPNAKINIGLFIKNRREDGFHNIETLFYPVELCDIVEVTPMPEGQRGTEEFINTGISIDTNASENLCIRALNLIKEHKKVPPVRIHLHKVVPMGAGLGGGSSDAAFVLKSVNELFNLGLEVAELELLASELGSDCPFFINNKPVLARGRGELFMPVDIDLSNYYIVIVHPGFSISTSQAYKTVVPDQNSGSLAELLSQDPLAWQGKVVNDFERVIFSVYPAVEEIKEKIIALGAFYSSLTGSGSAVYGLFQQKPDHGLLRTQFPEMFLWHGRL